MRVWCVLPLMPFLSGCVYATASRVASLPAPAASAFPEHLAEQEGFRLVVATDMSGSKPEGDHAEPVFYEVIPPPGKKAVLGRVYVSCSCLVAEPMPVRGDGRALLRIRRVHPPPVEGAGFVLIVWLNDPEGVMLQRLIPGV